MSLTTFFLIILIISSAALLICLMYIVIKYIFNKKINELIFPNYKLVLDITNKRINNDFISEIEKVLCDQKKRNKIYDEIDLRKNNIKKLESKSISEKSKLKKFIIDKALNIQKNKFIPVTFIFYRNQTKYKQQNYVRTSYKEPVIYKEVYFSESELDSYVNRLRKINFECTTKEYNEKNQRKLLTPEVRNKMLIRDNFTCQKCGKYLKDDLTNLHIDHIIPISKGGKTVESNLQCLCANCNLSKGAKSQ